MSQWAMLRLIPLGSMVVSTMEITMAKISWVQQRVEGGMGVDAPNYFGGLLHSAPRLSALLRKEPGWKPSKKKRFCQRSRMRRPPASMTCYPGYSHTIPRNVYR